MTRRELKQSGVSWVVLVGVALGGPLLWALHFGVGYLYAPAACAGWPMWPLHVFSVLVLLGIAASGWISYLVWRERVEVRGTVGSETEFLGLIGLLSAVLFAAVVIASGWASLVADPCTGLTSIP